jgi:hypothetical protein
VYTGVPDNEEGTVTAREDPYLPDSLSHAKGTTAQNQVTTFGKVLTISPSTDFTMAEELWEVINSALAASADHTEEQFLTEASLKPLMEFETVERILNEHTCRRFLKRDISIPILAGFITKHTVSVFAIVIWMEKPHLIEHFYRDGGFEQSMLPVKCTGSNSGWAVESCTDKAYNKALSEIFCQASWRFRDVQDFCTNQWPFSPQRFVEGNFRYELSYFTRKPFTRTWPMLGAGHSNYSRVEERSIHTDCLLTKIVRIPFPRVPRYIFPLPCQKYTDSRIANRYRRRRESSRCSQASDLVL